MRRPPGVAGAGQDPDWLQKTLRDLQRQIDQLRSIVAGGSSASATLTTRTLDGAVTSGSLQVATFNGASNPGDISVQTF